MRTTCSTSASPCARSGASLAGGDSSASNPRTHSTGCSSARATTSERSPTSSASRCAEPSSCSSPRSIGPTMTPTARWSKRSGSLERNEPAERDDLRGGRHDLHAHSSSCSPQRLAGFFPTTSPGSRAMRSLRSEQSCSRSPIARGEELLDRRFDAWPRLLSTFRAVHGGVEHERVRLPGYGGGLFDPDRYPFLETAGGPDPPNLEPRHPACARRHPDTPRSRARRRQGTPPALLRRLGVEQIGHVYERLLDHTAIRADSSGRRSRRHCRRRSPRSRSTLLDRAERRERRLLELLKEETGRSPICTHRRHSTRKPAPERATRSRKRVGTTTTLIEWIRALPRARSRRRLRRAHGVLAWLDLRHREPGSARHWDVLHASEPHRADRPVRARAGCLPRACRGQPRAKSGS